MRRSTRMQIMLRYFWKKEFIFVLLGLYGIAYNREPH